MKITLRRVNNVLSFVAVGLCLYVLLAPLMPEAELRVKDTPPLAAKEVPPEAIPAENTLVIPGIKLQETIHEGPKWVLNKGVWRVPKTSWPGGDGNMVLSGHRFTYGGPAVFYHLDKVSRGDTIIIYWDQKKHVYQVSDIRVVPPSATEVVKQTEEPLLTIYTCTPLLTAKNRLVIQAKPVENI